MAIVSASGGLITETSAVRLARYAQIINYSECTFWGVNHNVGENYCRQIWTLDQRVTIAKYLAEAQGEIEDVIGYQIGTDHWNEDVQNNFKMPVFTRYGYVIEPGIKAESTILAGAAVDHTNDPAVIGPLATIATDEDEIRVYHPGTTTEIDPSNVTISGGNVTIQIPRCRMVKADYADNPETGLAYNDLANFETTVDVVRAYTDGSTQAVLVDNHACSLLCSQYGCSEYTHDACVFVRLPDIGSLEVYRGIYNDGVWRRQSSTLCCSSYRYVRLYYRAGREVTRQMEDAIVRLAHAKMPSEPCGCDPIGAMWKRDTKVPDVLTKERLNCPFGLSDGAWWAYNQAKSLKLRRGGLAV